MSAYDVVLVIDGKLICMTALLTSEERYHDPEWSYANMNREASNHQSCVGREGNIGIAVSVTYTSLLTRW